jgi:hypothetical protein
MASLVKHAQQLFELVIAAQRVGLDPNMARISH